MESLPVAWMTNIWFQACCQQSFKNPKYAICDNVKKLGAPNPTYTFSDTHAMGYQRASPNQWVFEDQAMRMNILQIGLLNIQIARQLNGWTYLPRVWRPGKPIMLVPDDLQMSHNILHVTPFKWIITPVHLHMMRASSSWVKLMIVVFWVPPFPTEKKSNHWRNKPLKTINHIKIRMKECYK